MGKKNSAKVIAAFLALLIPRITVNAETSEDLYHLYGITIEDMIPEDVLATVSDYNTVRKFVAMYNYIDLAVPDTESQDKSKEKLEKEISDAENQLLNGYYLSYEEVLALEDKISYAYECIDYIDGTYDYEQVEIDIPNVSSIPSKDSYNQALNVMSQYTSSVPIGNLENLQLPIEEGTMVSHAESGCELITPKYSYALSLLNGDVLSVSDSSLTIRTGSQILIRYKDLADVYLEPGDTVEQYDRIGLVKESMGVEMIIADKHYDIYEMYKE